MRQNRAESKNPIGGFRFGAGCSGSSWKALFLGIILVQFFLIAACSPFAPEERPLPEPYLPKTFSLYTGGEKTLAPWWQDFGSPELDALVQEGLEGNLTLQEAWARLRQAGALSAQAGADRYPDLNAAAGATFGRQDLGSGSSNIEKYSLGLSSSYELDLWGRVSAQHRALQLQEEAARDDLNTAAMTITAEVAGRWVAITAARMQQELLKKQLQSNRTLLELIELRFRKAMVSALDVYQQKQVVENIQAEIPLVEEEEQLLRHELAVLLGKPPKAGLGMQRSQLPGLPPIPVTGIPADLLAQRPDVRAAGSRLQAADWQIAAARANRLPALRLTAGAQYGEGDLDVLFDRWLISLAGNLTAPLLDGGRRAAEVERTRAVADQNLAIYNRTVLAAVKEVEDALVSEAKQKQHIDGLRNVMATAGRALEEAGTRYRNGLNDYLPVLTQLTAVQSLERELIRKKAALLLTRIQLHRALGGPWTDSMELPLSSEASRQKENTAPIPES